MDQRMRKLNEEEIEDYEKMTLGLMTYLEGKQLVF